MQSLQTQAKVNTEVGVASERSLAALSVVDLRKSFATPSGDRIEVLRGITLDVQAGQTVAIIGASGSGKSTLLHLLGCLEDADHGTISLDGTDVVRLKGTDLAHFRQRSIGFVFQFHYLLADLSAVENIEMPLRIAGYSSADASARARDVLHEVGLENRDDFPISHLSGGEQQRVALARALVTTPQLLLADEPTGNLDASIGDEISRIIVNFVRKQSRMAIIATHNESLAGLCDRVMLLEGGRVRLI